MGGTDAPVGVESLLVIIRWSPKGLGNGESCRWSPIFAVNRVRLAFSES